MQYDELMVSLLMEGTCIKEEMKIDWIAEVSTHTHITFTLPHC